MKFILGEGTWFQWFNTLTKTVYTFSYCTCQAPIQPQTQTRFSEPDNRDWRGRSAQLPTSGEERSWENIRENRDSSGRSDFRQQETNQVNRQDQLNSQFARAPISSLQGVIVFYNPKEIIFKYPSMFDPCFMCLEL